MQEITLAVVLLLILVYRPQGIIGDRELGLAAAK
jgi:ABC-type branched-subunit amino acid transport system permease subunit